MKGHLDVVRVPSLERALSLKESHKPLCFSADGRRLLCATLKGLVVHDVG